MRTIGPPLTDDERQAFIAAARARVRVKFRHRGRSKRSLDCAGLLLVSLQAIGRPVFDVRAYGQNPHQDGLDEAVRTNLGDPVTDGPRAGDVLLMRFKGEPRHVGLVGEHNGRLTLIHSSADFGAVVEHGLSDDWLAQIVRVYRP